MRSLIAALALSATAVTLPGALAQPPIPNRYDGFAQGNASAPILLEAFYDLLCPDCAAAWPVVNQVVQSYGPNTIYFVMHTFPLPYHTYAFYAAQGAEVAASLGKDPFQWANACFAGQANFWNGATANMTTNAVVNMFGQMAQTSLGVSSAAFVTGLNDPNLNMNTRISWKYGCSRYVSGTPTFLLNGVTAPADSTWTFQQWKALIDSLLTPSGNARYNMIPRGQC